MILQEKMEVADRRFCQKQKAKKKMCPVVQQVEQSGNGSTIE